MNDEDLQNVVISTPLDLAVDKLLSSPSLFVHKNKNKPNYRPCPPSNKNTQRIIRSSESNSKAAALASTRNNTKRSRVLSSSTSLDAYTYKSSSFMAKERKRKRIIVSPQPLMTTTTKSPSHRHYRQNITHQTNGNGNGNGIIKFCTADVATVVQMEMQGVRAENIPLSPNKKASDGEHEYTLQVPFEILQPRSLQKNDNKSITSSNIDLQLSASEIISLDSNQTTTGMVKHWPLSLPSTKIASTSEKGIGIGIETNNGNEKYTQDQILKRIQEATRKNECTFLQTSCPRRKNDNNMNNNDDEQRIISLENIIFMLRIMRAGLLLHSAIGIDTVHASTTNGHRNHPIKSTKEYIMIPFSNSMAKLIPLSPSASASASAVQIDNYKKNDLERIARINNVESTSMSKSSLMNHSTTLEKETNDTNKIKARRVRDDEKIHPKTKTNVRAHVLQDATDKVNVMDMKVMTNEKEKDDCDKSALLNSTKPFSTTATTTTTTTTTTTEGISKKNVSNNPGLQENQWKEVIQSYQEYLCNDDTNEEMNTSTSKSLFINEIFPNAIKTKYHQQSQAKSDENDDNTTQQQQQQSSTLLSLLRDPLPLLQSLNHNNTENTMMISMLMSKTELTHCIKNRSTTPSTSDSMNNDINTNTNVGQVYLNLVELQIRLRIQLYHLFYCNNKNDDVENISLSSSTSSSSLLQIKNLRRQYDSIVGQYNQSKGSGKKKLKKKKKKKEFTSADFISETCTIVELIPFVLPTTNSFTHFIKDTFVKPFISFNSPLIEGIIDHFELEVLDDDNEDDSDDDDNDNELIEDNKVQDDENKQVQLQNPPSSNAVVEKRMNANDGKQSNQENREKENAILISALPSSSSKWDNIPETANPKLDDATSQEKAIKSPNRFTDDVKNTLLVQTQNLKLQPYTRNRLLADGRGKYIGRHLGNALFNEIKVVKPKQINKKLNTSKSKIEQKSSNSKNEIEGRISLRNQRTSLGGTVTKKAPIEPLLPTRKRPRIKFDDNGRDSKPNKYLKSAAALAARAGLAMRKKTKM